MFADVKPFGIISVSGRLARLDFALEDMTLEEIINYMHARPANTERIRACLAQADYENREPAKG